MGKSGTANLPLHGGSAPRWLFDRMEALGGAIAEAVIAEYGRDELLRRLGDPHWFQAFGCVLGFDWHSSGLTTTTMGALKEALDVEEHGVTVLGGKGGTSREVPGELERLEETCNLRSATVERLQRSSRLSAAVDNGCVQDAYTLYHHAFVVTEDGDWAVVQQGMGEASARRYHWLSDTVDGFVDEPQAGIAAMEQKDEVLDLTAGASGETRQASLDLVNDDPSHLLRYARDGLQTGLDAFTGDGTAAPHLAMPRHHRLTEGDLTERSIEQLQRAYERQPDDYEELVGTEGIGPKSLRALALIAEVVHDADAAREDPAKYAYAHGGKDGTPYPVDRERYDESIRHLQQALGQAAVDAGEKREALQRLAACHRET
ncbi:MAG: DUF763 domain-containing protein [Candidatus Nanohaloarchaea archaeon]|nr:DUF763 domain-containing protein [Candidatus Nanohaloarchaea archaeon]